MLKSVQSWLKFFYSLGRVLILRYICDINFEFPVVMFTRHTQTLYIQIILSPALPALWRSVSIVQKKSDLVLEDMEQDKGVKQVEKEVKEESQNKETVQPLNEKVSLALPVLTQKDGD